MPRRRMPVRIVVSLLWTFQAVPLVAAAAPIAIRVLACGGGTSIIVHLPICSVQTLVSFPPVARPPVIYGLVQPSCGVRCIGLGRIVVISCCTSLASSISQPRILCLAHVLQNDLTPHVGLTDSTSMLHKPLNVELRALIVLHGSLRGALLRHVVVVVCIFARWPAVVPDLVAGRRVVLRVEEAICVLNVVTLLPELVVRTPRIVQVHVC
mmetsp:Transcript_65689/g.105866  ORF Transcript_65689/g.105866 Transcript_65689/m.105866 type:complete len:210 (-) Transcript_65689:151-780(-)